MIYQSCSIAPVIGSIIRNTRLQDMSYVSAFKEWIPEAMELMETNFQTFGDFEELCIKFHKAKLPCGLHYIDAVEHCGHRLPYGNSVKSPKRPNIRERPERSVPQTWTSMPYSYPAPGDQTHLYFWSLEKVRLLPEHDKHYYQIEMGSILTDFENGPVTIYFQRIPVDNNGMPLIPDNQNFKQAIYWYVRGRMIGAGFDDGVFKYDYCDEQFEKHAARAIGEIKYPSPDQMEHRVNTLTRLVTKDNYWRDYFRVDQPEQFYDPLGPTDSYYI